VQVNVLLFYLPFFHFKLREYISIGRSTGGSDLGLARQRSMVMQLQLIMEFLDEFNEISLSQLALYTNTNYIKLRYTLREMIKAGLVAQKRNGRANNRISYTLTPNGRQAFSRLKEYTNSLTSMGIPSI
jgi:predicted transcriptional regulator